MCCSCRAVLCEHVFALAEFPLLLPAPLFLSASPSSVSRLCLDLETVHIIACLRVSFSSSS